MFIYLSCLPCSFGRDFETNCFSSNSFDLNCCWHTSRRDVALQSVISTQSACKTSWPLAHYYRNYKRCFFKKSSSSGMFFLFLMLMRCRQSSSVNSQRITCYPPCAFFLSQRFKVTSRSDVSNAPLNYFNFFFFIQPPPNLSICRLIWRHNGHKNKTCWLYSEKSPCNMNLIHQIISASLALFIKSLCLYMRKRFLSQIITVAGIK